MSARMESGEDDFKVVPNQEVRANQISHSAEYRYQRLPNHDAKNLKSLAVRGDPETRCGKIVGAIWFQNVMGLIIVGNAAALGMETEMAWWPHWEKVEMAFLITFTVEILMKFCVDGFNFLHPMHEDFVWNIFDLFIVGLGWFDSLMSALFEGSGTGGFSTIFRLFRLMRILRIFRLLKFLKRLYMLAMGLIEAAKAIFWVTILMGFVLYVCALVLVKTVGRPPQSDLHLEFMTSHFGNIGESMISLFVLMSSPNLPVYQEEDGLLHQHPYLTMFLIAFITFGSFGMLAMLTGVINESMFENNELQKAEKRTLHEEMRMSLGERTADLFDNLPANDEGGVAVEEVKRIAQDLLVVLEATGAHFAEGDIMKLIDHMDVDASGTISIDEFMHATEKISEGGSPMATLEVHHLVGQCQRAIMIIDGRTVDILNDMQGIGRSMKRCNEREFAAESFQKTMAQHMAETKLCVSTLSDQISNAEKRLQYTVDQQVGEIGKSVQRLLDLKVDSSENRLQFAFGQQIEDIQNSVQKLLDGKDGTRDMGLGLVMERIENSVSSIHATQVNTKSVQDAGYRQVTEIQKSIDRLLEQDSKDRSCQAASAGLLEFIATSVQKILTTKDGRDAQTFQGMEDIRISMQRLFDQVQQSSEARIQELHRQVDAAQANLLGGVAELGGVVLDGVGELLSKRMVAMQESLIKELADLHGLALQNMKGVMRPNTWK